MSAPPRANWGSLGRWLPGLILSGLAILLLAQLADWREVVRILRTMPLEWLLLAFLFYVAGHLLRAQVWRILLQYKATYGRCFLSLMEGYLLNNILPFRLGELGMVLMLSQAAQISAFFVLSTIIIMRAYDIALAAGFLLGTLPFVLEIKAANTVGLTVLLLVILGLVLLFLAARYRTLFKVKLEKLAGPDRFLLQKVVRYLGSMLEGLGVLVDPKQLVLSVLLMVLSWVMGNAEVHILILSLGVSAAPWWSGFVLGVVSLGIALPSAPAGLGVYEVAMVAALSALGLSASQALAVAIVAHLIHITFTGIVGTYGLFRDGETLTGLYQRLRGQVLSQVM